MCIHIIIGLQGSQAARGGQAARRPAGKPAAAGSPYLPAKIIPTKITWLNISGRFPVDTRIPPLKIKNLLESNPLKSRISES